MKPRFDISQNSNMKNSYIIGIDPGVKTGIAVWETGRQGFKSVLSTSIINAMKYVATFNPQETRIRIEDARKRQWFGKTSREVLQGAGSIKRDCQIWEEFCLTYDFEFELVAPKNNKTKLDAKLFARYTGWKERTNEHARDAAMLVYQLKN